MRNINNEMLKENDFFLGIYKLKLVMIQKGSQLYRKVVGSYYGQVEGSFVKFCYKQ